MNEAPLPGQVFLSGRAKRNPLFVFLCALVSLREEILHAKPQRHQGMKRKGRRWIEPTSRLPEVPHGTRGSDREWAMNEAPFTAATVRRGEWFLSCVSSDHRERAVKYLLLHSAPFAPWSLCARKFFTPSRKGTK